MASQDDIGASVPLPTDRYESYMYSKRDTNEVLDWLRLNASKAEKHCQLGLKLTLSDIRYAAKVVVAKKIKVPNHIKEAFKRLLRLRSGLTTWFRKVETVKGKAQSASTDSHQAFNNTLTQVYHIMFPGNEQLHSIQHDTQPSTSISDSRISDNLYDILASIGEDELSDSSLDTEAQCLKSKIFEVDNSKDAMPDYIIEGDPLRDQCEAMLWLLELDIGCSLVQRWFEKVRDNGMPIVLATTLSTTLAHHFMITEYVKNSKKSFSSCGQVFTMLARKSGQDAQQPGQDARASGCPDLPGVRHAVEGHRDHKEEPCYKFCTGFPLLVVSYALKDFVSRKGEPGFIDSVERRPIQSYFRTPAEETKQEHACRADAEYNKLYADYKNCISIFRSIWNHEHANPSPTPTFTKGFVKLVQDYEACGIPNCPCNKMATSFAWYTQVILESARSFIWKNGEPNPVNCRIQAMRLSQEIIASVEKVMDIDTADSCTFGTDMNRRNQSLWRIAKRFLATSHFDLFHQSPLVAGRESCELLAYALCNGQILLDQKGMFGTVLYFYKVSQSVTGGSFPITVLDNLCEIFRESVFMGEFPTKNYELVYAQFRKTPRKVPKKHGRQERGARRELDWDKAYWLAEGHQDRISRSRLSSWFDLEARGSKLDGEFWACLAGIDKKRKMSRGAILQVERVMRTEPLAKVFAHLEEALSKEFDKGSKVARINLFKVYELVIQTLRIIGKKIKERLVGLSNLPSPVEAAMFDIDEEMYGKNEQIENGMVAAFVLFRKLDETKNSREGKLFGLVNETIGEVWGDLDMESLYWKSI